MVELGNPYGAISTNVKPLQGFDEFMNLVIDDAVEVKQPTKTDTEEKRRELGLLPLRALHPIWLTEVGQILLKGDNVSLIQALQ